MRTTFLGLGTRPVFSNAIYHDNKYARYCFRGHFKILRLIIYYKLFRILRIHFISTGHTHNTDVCCIKDASALDVYERACRSMCETLWIKYFHSLTADGAEQQKCKAAALLSVSETYSNYLNSHSDFCGVHHSTKN